MFTGIIEETGKIKEIKEGRESANLTIEAEKVLEETKEGDSIAVDGVCLTVTKLMPDAFEADVMGETLSRSTIGSLKPENEINLERAMKLETRLGGHLVSGHIDGRGTIKKLEKKDNSVWVTVGAEPKLLRYITEKGSIAIDGISLTVAAVDETSFAVAIIPHTGDHTTLLQKKVGDKVNLECDMIGKYVEKLMKTNPEVIMKSGGGK